MWMAYCKIRSRVTDQATELLSKVVEENIFDNPNAIWRSGNKIFAFGAYQIIKSEHGYYTVYKGGYFVDDFSSSRSSLSWCILDKLGRKFDAEQLQLFDREINRRKNEMMYYRKYINSKKISQFEREIRIDRLDDAKLYYRANLEQLNKCINVAKYWQQKGFDNETLRP